MNICDKLKYTIARIILIINTEEIQTHIICLKYMFLIKYVECLNL